MSLPGVTHQVVIEQASSSRPTSLDHAPCGCKELHTVTQSSALPLPVEHSTKPHALVLHTVQGVSCSRVTIQSKMELEVSGIAYILMRLFICLVLDQSIGFIDVYVWWVSVRTEGSERQE